MSNQRLFSSRHSAEFVGRKPLCTVIVDAEEDFDWISPVPGTAHSVENMRHINEFQKLCGVYGAKPTYLLTYPVLSSPEIVCDLKRYASDSLCGLGIQLHSWVNPPFEQSGLDLNANSFSYAGNLPSTLEENKFEALIEHFERAFGFLPTMYRAGRYGLSSTSARLLEKHRFRVDTSVAPRTDFTAAGGPDYRDFSSAPFWFGEIAPVFELPLCRDLVGWLKMYRLKIYEFGNTTAGRALHVHAFASACRAIERITLSPEGNDLKALKRLARSLRRDNRSIYVVSFHSSSLSVGKNPYVSTTSDWRKFQDRLSGILHYMKFNIGAEFVELEQVPTYYKPVRL